MGRLVQSPLTGDMVTPTEAARHNAQIGISFGLDMPDPDGVELAVDMVTHPSHYQGKGGLEAITVIRAFGLDESFELGSATKYLLRADAKGSKVENIRKARQMLDMWLEEHDT